MNSLEVVRLEFRCSQLYAYITTNCASMRGRFIFSCYESTQKLKKSACIVSQKFVNSQSQKQAGKAVQSIEMSHQVKPKAIGSIILYIWKQISAAKPAIVVPDKGSWKQQLNEYQRLNLQKISFEGVVSQDHSSVDRKSSQIRLAG